MISKKRIGSFSNGNRRGSRIQSASWINETHKSLLMTAAGDGVVRAWGGVMEAEAYSDGGAETERKMDPPDLVTAFQAIPVRGSGRD